MKRIFIFTFLLLLAVRVVSAATVDTLAVHSPSMDRDVPVVAIVPEGVSAAEPCPVVYLLHGYSGDETAWLKIKPSLPAIADRERIAFICPGFGIIGCNLFNFFKRFGFKKLLPRNLISVIIGCVLL